MEVRNGEVTRELYAGSVRGPASGSVRQPEYLQDLGNVVNFDAPDELVPGAIYFDGAWRIGLESARHGRETTAYEDSLSLVYSARSVNAVLTSETGQPYKVLITLDGDNLTEQNKGADVIIDSNGESYLQVSAPPAIRCGRNSELRPPQHPQDGVKFQRFRPLRVYFWYL